MDLFFVLSGYLIGGQLWKEYARRETVDVGAFVVRRGLRIWPYYFAVVAFVALVLRPDQPAQGRCWADLVFLTNYYQHNGIALGSWSLCTEEQFYILAPLLILGLGAAAGVRGPGFRWVLAGLMAAPVAVRLVTSWRLTGVWLSTDLPTFRVFYEPIHTHADGLVFGLLLANLRVFPPAGRSAGRLGSGWAVVLATAAGVGLYLLGRNVTYFTSLALGFGVLLWHLVHHPGRYRWLTDRRAFYLLSKLSFGMYLNHEYMPKTIILTYLDVAPWLAGYSVLLVVLSFVTLVVASAALAVVTYCLIEHPFLAWRDRILARRAARPAGREGGPTGLVAPSGELVR